MYTEADIHLLRSQIEMIQRNERIIKDNAPMWMRVIFREKCIPWCHGRKYQDQHYTIILNRDSTNDMQVEIYNECLA